MAHRELAAATLTRLAVVHKLLPLVKQTLEDWVDTERVYPKCTAALVYGSRFGRRDQHAALAQLARIGRSTSEQVQDAVTRGLLEMLTRPDCRGHVFGTVVSWLEDAPEPMRPPDGLRTVGLKLGMWVVGFYPEIGFNPVDPATLADEYLSEVSFLTEHILCDKRFGPWALSRLSRLETKADWERLAEPDTSTARVELVRILTLVAPDLRRWQRRRTVTRLCKAHPTRRTEIRRIFRTARKIQRATMRCDDGRFRTVGPLS
jgi:hypothetical protein